MTEDGPTPLSAQQPFQSGKTGFEGFKLPQQDFLLVVKLGDIDVGHFQLIEQIAMVIGQIGRL